MKFGVLASLFVLGLACQSESEPPRDPVWGKQPCSGCAMLLSSPRFAAQSRSSSGDRRYFDDVGCLAAFAFKQNSATKQAWVRAPDGAWVSTETARFDEGAKTPMDYGFVFSPNGKLTWNDVQKAVAQRVAARSEP